MRVQMWMVNERPVALSPARWMLLSFIKDAHSLEKSGRYCLWSPVSNCAFAFSSSKLCPHPGTRVRVHTHSLSHTHGCLFGRSFLFVQHRVLPPWLPNVESSKSWRGRQKQNSTRAVLQGVGYAGMFMWCGCTCLFCERHFSEAVKVRSPGIN